MNNEFDSAVAALMIAGLDKDQAGNIVMKFQSALPEATAEDLTQIALQSAILAKVKEGLIPNEVKSYLPHLVSLLEQM